MDPKRCSDEEVARALSALDGHPVRVRACDWPAQLASLDESGLYTWWVDEVGAADLAGGLGLELETGRIYAGQTGATKWPSGTSSNETLARRVGRLHLKGRIRASTFRLTLAAILRERLGLMSAGPTKLTAASEAALTRWISEHLEVACFPYPDRDALDDLETKVLGQLAPPLNLAKMPPSLVRVRLKKLRHELVHPAIANPGAPT